MNRVNPHVLWQMVQCHRITAYRGIRRFWDASMIYRMENNKGRFLPLLILPHGFSENLFWYVWTCGKLISFLLVQTWFQYISLNPNIFPYHIYKYAAPYQLQPSCQVPPGKLGGWHGFTLVAHHGSIGAWWKPETYLLSRYSCLDDLCVCVHINIYIYMCVCTCQSTSWGTIQNVAL